MFVSYFATVRQGVWTLAAIGEPEALVTIDGVPVAEADPEWGPADYPLG